MQIDRKNLQNALEIVRPGLSRKEEIEQATSFAFFEDKVVTYNDEISLSHPVKGLNITGAIKADELYKLLGKLKKDEITIETTDNELHIVCGKARAGISMQKEIKLPLDEIGKVNKFKPIEEDFIEGLRFTMYGASKDMSRPILTCVHINEGGFIEASDNLRLINYKVESIPIKTTLLPATIIPQILKINPNKIAETHGWIHFKNEQGTQISCRIFEKDDYPSTDKILISKGVEFNFPTKTISVIERARIFSGNLVDTLEAVRVDLTKNKMKISSKGDAGWFEESINIENDLTLSFEINASIMKDILNKTQRCIIDKNKLLFDGEKWKYITLLLS